MVGASMYDYLVEEERRKYEMEKAEHYRLLKQVSQSEGSQYGRLLSALGAKLVASGRRLQQRWSQEEYANPANRPIEAQA